MSILFTLVKSHPTASSTLVLFSVWSPPWLELRAFCSTTVMVWCQLLRSVSSCHTCKCLPCTSQLCVLREPCAVFVAGGISFSLTTCLVCTKQNEITLIRALYWGWIILISQSEHDDGKQLFNFFISVVCGTALKSSKLSTGHRWQSRLSTESISMSWKSMLKIASHHLEIRSQDLSA